MIRPPPKSTLFPYPTLFRSRGRFLDLRHQLHFGRDERAQLAQVLRPPHEGEAQIVDAGRRRVLRVLAILRSEEHTSELQSQSNLVCRLLLEKKKKQT